MRRKLKLKGNKGELKFRQGEKGMRKVMEGNVSSINKRLPQRGGPCWEKWKNRNTILTKRATKTFCEPCWTLGSKRPKCSCQVQLSVVRAKAPVCFALFPSVGLTQGLRWTDPSGSRQREVFAAQALCRPDPPVTRHKLDWRPRPPSQRQATCSTDSPPLTSANEPNSWLVSRENPDPEDLLQSLPCTQLAGFQATWSPCSKADVKRHGTTLKATRRETPQAWDYPAAGHAWNWKGNLERSNGCH